MPALVKATSRGKWLLPTLLIALAGSNAPAALVTAPMYQVGNSPAAVAVGDFNEDGHLDLAVADSNPRQPGTLSVLLGNGDGTFQAAQTYPVGSFPLSVAVGDFNDDGHLDLAVANALDTTVSILLGNGDGTFQPGQSLPSPWAIFVAVADFNSDGFLDLAVLNNQEPNTQTNQQATISILLGNGDGTFQSAGSYSVGPLSVLQAYSLAVGDFNGDNHLDLAVAFDATSKVLLGNGDGSFQTAQELGPAGNSVAVGDFNGDGIPDLVVANELSGTVFVYLAKGDGTFEEPRAYVVHVTGPPTGPDAVVVGDFDGDGRLDLAVCNGYDTNGTTVTILSGNGEGAFQIAQLYAAGPSPVAGAVADFNGDGFLDLAIINSNGYFSGEEGSVSVFLGHGDRTFQGARAIPSGPFYSSSLAVGDFNGDGIADLAVTNYQDNPLGAVVDGRAAIFLGNGDGTFRAPLITPAGKGPVAMAVGDFNGDGKEDLVTVNYAYQYTHLNEFIIVESDVRIYLGKGDGTFETAKVIQGSGYPACLTVGDFNGDGIPDLAIGNGQTDGASSVDIFLGNGDGTFQAARTYALRSAASEITAADFNGDGYLDLAVGSQTGLRVLLGNGDGTFRPAQNYQIPSVSVAVADFNGDGHLDVAVTDGATPGSVNILLGNGDAPSMRPRVTTSVTPRFS